MFPHSCPHRLFIQCFLFLFISYLQDDASTRQFRDLWTADWLKDHISVEQSAWRRPTLTCPDLTEDERAKFVSPKTPAEHVLHLLRRVGMKRQPNTTLRVLMTGLTQSGKTSFVTRAHKYGSVSGLPGDESSRTQGVDLSTVDVPIPDTDPPRDAQLVLFDFGGHFEYWPIRAQFLSQDCVVAVTFNMKTLLSGSTNKAFEEVMLWVEAVEGSLGGGSTVGVVLLGTHLDSLKTDWDAANASSSESAFMEWVELVMNSLYGRVKRRVTGSTSSPTRLMGWAALCLIGGIRKPTPLESLVCIPATSSPSLTDRTNNPVDQVLQSVLSAASSALPGFFNAAPGKGAVELVHRWVVWRMYSGRPDLPYTLVNGWSMSLHDLSDILLQLSKDQPWFNISSDAGRRGTIGQINYGAAKSGVMGISMSAAREWARYGIRVNALSPSGTTRMSDTYIGPDGKKHPMPYIDPELNGPVLVYLCSDEGNYVSGQVFGTGGERISILNHPSYGHTLIMPDGWTIEAVQQHFKQNFGNRLQPLGITKPPYPFSDGFNPPESR